jgi:hypothetical protein
MEGEGREEKWKMSKEKKGRRKQSILLFFL